MTPVPPAAAPSSRTLQRASRSLESSGRGAALDFLLDVCALGDVETFVRHVVEGLPRVVASEITTLSVCDIDAGTRRVVAAPGNAIGAAEQEIFNALIHEHPLVRFHSEHADGGARRISDSHPRAAFQRLALYHEYYRRIGIDHVVAVPVLASPHLVMSFVLNRKGRDFSASECELLNRLQPALANLYRFASMAAAQKRAAENAASAAGAGVTPREHEVLRWAAAGKTDRQIAAILGLSARTVQKHLENAYVKLGVENRTAAVARLRGALPPA